MSESEDGRSRIPRDENRCRVENKRGRGRCKNRAIGETGICSVHLRDRVVLVRASGGIELGAEIPDADG